MTFIAWQHRLGAALLLVGSAATVLTLAGCEVSPAKKPPATTDADDKDSDKAAAAKTSESDGKPSTEDASSDPKVASKDEAMDKTAVADTEVPADEAHADPFVVPDGTVEELLQYIENVQTLESQANSQKELTAFQQKIGRAISTAADRILAQDPKVGEAFQAMNKKSRVLEFLAESGDAQAAAEHEKFLEQLKTDERPDIVQAFKQLTLVSLLKHWDDLDADQRTAFLEQLKQFFANVPVSADTLKFGMAIGSFLESNEQSTAAAELYSALGARVADSTDPELAEAAARLQGMARRLQLVGNEMEIAGTLLDGAELDWASYRGKVVLVDFWATWCGPCIAELPNVMKNYEKYHDQGFEVVGISLDDNKEKVEGFVTEAKIPWAIVFSADEAHQGWEHPMAVKYGITGIPAAILINQEGKVVALEARGPELGEQLEKLLGKGSEASSEENKTEEKKTDETKSDADAPKADAKDGAAKPKGAE